MKAKEIKQLREKVTEWYRQNQRDLPWRRSNNPYRIWVSEVMLQQTQVNTVLTYYQCFLKKFPSIKILAKADLEEVLKVWEGLGYYARARNLQRAARLVLKDYNGKVPYRWEDFRSLPGVGDRIAITP